MQTLSMIHVWPWLPLLFYSGGSAVPAKVSETFRVRISTGGWAVVSLYGEDNTVACFNFSGLIKTAAEDATIEAVFEVNANSILQVRSSIHNDRNDQYLYSILWPTAPYNVLCGHLRYDLWTMGMSIMSYHKIKHIKELEKMIN